MEKVITFTMIMLIVATIGVGAQAVSDLNDGRVLTAVKALQK